MPRYFVKLERTRREYATVEVEAESEREAIDYVQFDDLQEAQRSPWIEDEDAEGGLSVRAACSPTCQGWRIVDYLLVRCSRCARFETDRDAIQHVLASGEVRFAVVDSNARVVESYPADERVHAAMGNAGEDVWPWTKGGQVRMVLALSLSEWETARERGGLPLQRSSQ